MLPKLGPVLALALLVGLAACRSGDEERPDVPDAVEEPSAAGEENLDETAGTANELITADAMTNKSDSESGVQGLVTLGPRCPAQEEGQDCPDRPYSTRLVVRHSESGDTVATISSGEDGRFRLSLDPGDYILIPESAQLVHEPRAQPLPFTVRPGEYTQVEMRFDSGAR